MCQQGYSSKVLVIYCMSPESEKMNIKITKMQMWTGKHTKHVSFKKTESKVKLGTLHFNNMKNIAGRYEALFDINAMDRVQVGNKTCTVKDYLMELKSVDSKLFAAAEQGSGNMENNMLVIITPKLKVVARKWISTKHGIELKVEGKENYATTFMPYETQKEQKMQTI